jgi:predicted nucleotidyltransferase
VKTLAIDLPLAKLDSFCRDHAIRWMALFGSVLRSDFAPDSDVDVLVEFEPEHTPGLGFFGIEQDLQRLLGRTVDLHTPRSLALEFRDAVLAEAETVYGSRE